MNYEFYMQKCLELASASEGYVSPNPLVGCVIVDDTGEIIAHWKKEDFDVYDYVMENEYIYSFMYGHRCKLHPIEKDIIQIPTKELKWSEDKTVFYYVWGFPGPDFNIYKKEDYLKTWALSKQGLIEAWKELENNNENN